MAEAAVKPEGGSGSRVRSRSPPKRGSSPRDAVDDDIGGVGVLDVLRVLGGMLLLGAALSWYVTGDSLLWGWRPWFSRVDGLRAWMNGPVILTDAELAAYDGSDASKPVYLALNGTIYDVSAGRHFYGPGGSYHFFAGRDAARAFVTGCFDEDLTPDLRGVEDMFIPLDEPSPDDGDGSGPTAAELDIRRQKEAEKARDQIEATIRGWAKVFSGDTGKDYLEVGKVRRDEGWLDKLPPRELCEKAKKHRPTRKQAEEREKKKAKAKAKTKKGK